MSNSDNVKIIGCRSVLDQMKVSIIRLDGSNITMKFNGKLRHQIPNFRQDSKLSRIWILESSGNLALLLTAFCQKFCWPIQLKFAE